MTRSTTPSGPGPGPGTTTSNPAISGVGSGMGAGNAAGPPGGVQAGTVNNAAQGSSTGDAADPSLGSGMVVPGQGDRMGDAATAGASGMADRSKDVGAVPIEPFALPYKVTTPPNDGR